MFAPTVIADILGVMWSRSKTICNLVEAGEAIGIKFVVTIDEYARSGEYLEFDDDISPSWEESLFI